MLLAWAIWLGILATTTIGGFLYIKARLITVMPWPEAWKSAAALGLALSFLVPVATMLLMRHAEAFGHRIAWLTYPVLGLISIVFTLLVFRDVGLLGGRLVDWVSAIASGGSLRPFDPARRMFVQQTTNVAILGAAGVLTAYGVYGARRRPRIVELAIPIRNLPAAFEGFRIVQISDIHAGLTVKRDWVAVVANEVSALRPDMIAFTGDLADGSVGYLRPHVAPLAELRAPDGKFFVTGNHEYYSGVEEWVDEAERMGFTTLNNAHRVVERGGSRLVVAGVTDYTGGQFSPQHRSDPNRAIEGAPADTTRILLAHQPRSFTAAEPLGFDLVLMGHTHGGQFFPWNLAAAVGQPFVKGLHRRNGTWAYVSMGTGYWGPPVRLATRSEITVIRLTAEDVGGRV